MKTRPSRRYQGFLRVHNEDYRQALVKTLIEDGADLIEMFGLEETIRDLKVRLDDPANHSAVGKLTRGISSGARRPLPMRMSAEDFNRQAENYYRIQLRERHLTEAVYCLIDDLRTLESTETQLDDEINQAMHQLSYGRSVSGIVEQLQNKIVTDRANEGEIKTLINLTLLTIRQDIKASERTSDDQRNANAAPATASSVY